MSVVLIPQASLPIETFLRDYEAALARGEAAVFVGAGLSRAAGFVDWKGLLADFAGELGLDLDVESDLAAVAQYHLNSEGQARGRLNQKIVEEFNREAELSDAHRALAQLPVKTVWTSNYDRLIEDAVKLAGKRVVVRSTRSSLTTSPKADIEVIKLHGDASDPERVVITKDDYQRFERDKEGLLFRLRSDLIAKSFLFVGFSFADPNLEIILSQVRSAVGDSQRTHYAMFRQPDRSDFRSTRTYKYEANRWSHRLADLRRYGVQPVVVSDYDDVPRVLDEVRVRFERRQILVSGSWVDPGPWSAERLETFCAALGQRIISEDYNLVSGFGIGVGGPTIMGAIEQLYRSDVPALDERLKLRPFPDSQPRNVSREAFLDRYRRDLVSAGGFVIFISGNRRSESGDVEPAPGVAREYEIARELGRYPLPIGATGWVAGELWDRTLVDFDQVFPRHTSRRHFRTLASAHAGDKKMLDAVFHLVRFLTPRAN